MRCEYGSAVRVARRRRVASRLRVLACIASWAVAPDGPFRPRKSATVARMNLGISSSYSLCEGRSLLPLRLRHVPGPREGLLPEPRPEERAAAGDLAPAVEAVAAGPGGPRQASGGRAGGCLETARR